MSAVVSLGQTAQCSPCSNLIQELQTRTNFWCTRVQVLGAVGKIDVKKRRKGNSKRRKGGSLFLKKETHRMFGILSQIEHPSRYKQRYFLSRGQNSVPAQKIRGLLESSLDVGRYFQPRAFTEFPVRQEIAQIRRAVPSNREAIDEDVVALIVGQTVERRLTLGACNTFVPVLLDRF